MKASREVFSGNKLKMEFYYLLPKLCLQSSALEKIKLKSLLCATVIRKVCNAMIKQTTTKNNCYIYVCII